MPRDEASIRFLDGMRVAAEHMRHLQQASIDRARELREALGIGKVHFGLKVESGQDATVTVSPGLAFDAFGRPVVVDGPLSLAFDGDKALLVAAYELRSSLLIGGVPTLLANGAKIDMRTAPPPYDDGAVPFAELTRDASGLHVLQKGEWYLPPLDHRHSGAFFTDAEGRWRYDGAAVGASSVPQYDSGFVPVAAGETLHLVHGLKSTELAVELTARRDDGIVTNRGVGADFWFELHGEDEIQLTRAASAEAPALVLRVRAWLLGKSATELARPVADAGDDFTVEPGTSFTLDAGGSRALGAQHLVRFIWTQLT